jgi:hypothetical protein
MTFNDSRYEYYCTGSLVNNVREDGTPYFLTANHCISTNAMAQTLSLILITRTQRVAVPMHRLIKRWPGPAWWPITAIPIFHS